MKKQTYIFENKPKGVNSTPEMVKLLVPEEKDNALPTFTPNKLLASDASGVVVESQIATIINGIEVDNTVDFLIKALVGGGFIKFLPNGQMAIQSANNDDAKGLISLNQNGVSINGQAGGVAISGSIGGLNLDFGSKGIIDGISLGTINLTGDNNTVKGLFKINENGVYIASTDAKNITLQSSGGINFSSVLETAVDSQKDIYLNSQENIRLKSILFTYLESFGTEINTNGIGFKYLNDESATFTDRSIPDVAWVLANASGGTVDISGKVDKEAGKSLILDTEITRLGTLVADTQILVSTSQNVQLGWNKKTIIFDTSCTITVPATLVEQHEFNFIIKKGITVTWAKTDPFVWYLENPPSPMTGSTFQTKGYFLRELATNNIHLEF